MSIYAGFKFECLSINIRLNPTPLLRFKLPTAAARSAFEKLTQQQTGPAAASVQMIRVQCFSAVEVCRNMTRGVAVKRRWLAQFDTDQLVQPTVVAPAQSRAFACGQPDPRYAALRRTTLNIRWCQRSQHHLLRGTWTRAYGQSIAPPGRHWPRWTWKLRQTALL